MTSHFLGLGLGLVFVNPSLFSFVSRDRNSKYNNFFQDNSFFDLDFDLGTDMIWWGVGSTNFHTYDVTLVHTNWFWCSTLRLFTSLQDATKYLLFLFQYPQYTEREVVWLRGWVVITRLLWRHKIFTALIAKGLAPSQHENFSYFDLFSVSLETFFEFRWNICKFSQWYVKYRCIFYFSFV